VRFRSTNQLALFTIVLVVIFGSLPAVAQASGSVPDLNTILDRMEQAEAVAHAQAPAYSVTRAYKFYSSDSQKPNSEVVAKVEYLPPTQKTFNIEQQQGSGQGAKIVRKVLEHETESAKKQDGEHCFSRNNYDFEFVRTDRLDGRPVYVLNITPKHNDKDSVKGQIWVDANTYLVRRVEGDLAKSPSWWIKDVHLVLNYGRVAGIWLQTATLAVANVRFFGRHSMVEEALACQPKFDLARATPLVNRNITVLPATLPAANFRP
jgi:outer membrane lipoprotein-sorting protein